jgi:hypothetical protein
MSKISTIVLSCITLSIIGLLFYIFIFTPYTYVTRTTRLSLPLLSFRGSSEATGDTSDGVFSAHFKVSSKKFKELSPSFKEESSTNFVSLFSDYRKRFADFPEITNNQNIFIAEKENKLNSWISYYDEKNETVWVVIQYR